MNIIDKIMSSLGVTDGNDVENVEQVESATAEQREPKKNFFKLDRDKKETKKDTVKPEPVPSYKSPAPSYQPERRSKVVNMSSPSIASISTLNMVIQQPSEYNGAKEIARYLKDRQPVVVNLEKLDKVTAQKVVDFVSGAVFALDGRIQKVSNGIIVAVPSTMGITGYINDDAPASSIFDELDF